jgi:hypothetical protein
MNYQDDPNSHYSVSLDQYLKDGIGWDANCFKNTERGDMEQFAVDSFHAGWLAKQDERIANVPKMPPQTLVQELASILNRRSLENGSYTPDFILADYLSRCLVLFDDATKARANWYGQPMKDLEFNKVAGACVTPEEKKAAQADALKKHQFPAGGVIGEMRKQAAREIMADIENQTADTLHGHDKKVEYVPADFWEEFNRTNTELARLWNNHQHQSQEDIARIIETAMKITEAFTVAAKAIKVFKEEEKGAREAWDRMAAASLKGQNPHVAGGQTIGGLLTDRHGFFFLTARGQVLWAMHDGNNYCYCEWEPYGWIGWQVEEVSIKEAREQQLPANLDAFIREKMPTH